TLFRSEQAQLAVIQVGHVCTDRVQEVAVVGNDDHGAVTDLENVLQPADGVDIQVVGRFVQQQHFRIGEQRLGQQNAQLPAGRSEEHTSELQSRENLVCRLLLEKKKKKRQCTTL